MPPVVQGSLFGGETIAGTIVDKLTHILQSHPEARDDYKTAMALYWLEFDGLDEVLGEQADAFRQWFESRATAPKTLQNRTMEIQNKYPTLEASSDVEEWRQRQATAGPVM